MEKRYENMDIFEIAKYIIVRCESKRSPITSVKLNYMLFIFSEVMRKEHGKIAFTERDVDNTFLWEAVHPTYEAVYKKYRTFGALPIELKLPYEEERAILHRNFPYKAVVEDCIDKVLPMHIFELYEWYLEERITYTEMAQ